MNGIQNIFLNLIRQEISGYNCNTLESLSISPSDQKMLFSLAKKHDVAHIVAAALKKFNVEISDEIWALFQKEQALVLYRYMQLTSEARLLYAALDAAGIRYMVLKGSEIRKHYPSPEMRVSSDIDILVAPEDFERTLKILSDELEYTMGVKTSYDISTFSPANVHVEVHFKLTSEDERYDAALAEVWETSLPDGDSASRRIMSPEIQLAYTVMHTAKHFHNGGCGVRFLMDIFVLENKLQFDKAVVLEILAKCNLTKFYEEIHRLAWIWFADVVHTELTQKMQDYILKAGIYGNLENKVAVFQTESGGRFKYALSRIFPKKSYLEITYPRLKSCVILYPYYMVKRWLRIIFKRRKEAFSELKSNATVSDERTNHLRSMLDELKL